MSKVYIWIGQFQSNAEFETYNVKIITVVND